ncbi:S26 family signal peptidase [Haloterrigena alkaliphila]|uniref:S26 family signal peptidase n=1 Tax=Haloterrigena alkaliphila TaxID=2816475 RepID=A0A8A2VJX1_9EURY|nr:S26 family signal peptidase [Haloterrigena alkaliphila]QSX00623.1 S26 family signal peptidase [Haloterrigena alkaliphila]
MSGSNRGDPPDGPGDDGNSDSATDRPARNGTDDPATDDGPADAGTSSNPREADGSGAETDGDPVTIEDDGAVRWFLNSQDGNVIFVRDVLSSVAIVAVVGLLLFAVSGVWPPLVAVESGSMEPNMERGDLIFVVDDDRYAGDGATDGTGVVTLENGQDSGHDKFGNPGDVIVFQPNGNDRQTPIIHRAHFWVEEDENWVDTKADEDLVGDLTCEDVDDRICPADHAGFITKGDANPSYDQLSQRGPGGPRTHIVKPEWIAGKAMFRIPWLGHVRLAFDSLFGGMVVPSPLIDGTSTQTPTAGPEATSPGAEFAGVTGVAGVGAGAVVAVGRYRN